MGLSGIPSCIIRFICHIPSGMGGVGGMAQYNKVKVLQDVLEVVPHGKDYLRGLKIDSHVGSLLEQKFLPGSVGACNGAENWMNATDGTNLFVKLFEGGGYTDPVSVCKGMMTTWIVNLIVVVFYYIVGAGNIFIGLAGLDSYSHHSWSLGHGYDLPRRTWNFIRPVIRFIGHLIYFTIRFHIRFWSRLVHTLRWYAPFGSPKLGETETMSFESTEKLLQHEKGTPLPKLSEPLPFEVAALISRSMHFIDVVQAAEASPILRGRFLGYDDPQGRLDALREIAKSSTEHHP
ncbi:unnamed protein product [Parascedosporium putredinis]|uniref:Uncharacterized protein n=1 Tax=Parascedosporium putredinis TaxID=1442378 RepID=A0A9P1H509_9PEZI|nr:unnamed protein product [Parascedosporium putredinis]CAI7996137.1 unnamed protein product [Parascedosporium putredinis]